MDLRDKTALVTGGGTGIGAAIARALSAEGVRLMLAGRRTAPLHESVEAIRNNGGQASFMACDVRSHEQCEALVNATLERLGRIDILVNNAGVSGHGKYLGAHSAEEWDVIMDTNLRSAFLVSKAALPGMLAQGAGYIVNISSISGMRCYPGEAVYGVSKHALNALTEYIVEEYGIHGIRAVAVCPGLVHTDMGLALKPRRLEHLISPDDVAGAVVWILRQPDTMTVPSPLALDTKSDPWDGQGAVIAEPTA
jgi:NAD(P)-dependent dehydrogenase (short-subunit alcohol dehydrogenase family)